MSTNYVNKGDVITVPAPTGGVVSSMAYLIGGVFGVATVSADEDDPFAFAVSGVWELPAATHATTQAIDACGPVYWDATNHVATKNAAGNLLIGAATADKESTADKVKVKLWPRAAAPAAAIADVATTGATNTTPYGFTTAAQADAIVAKLNLVLAALRLHGIVTA